MLHSTKFALPQRLKISTHAGKKLILEEDAPKELSGVSPKATYRAIEKLKRRKPGRVYAAVDEKKNEEKRVDHFILKQPKARNLQDIFTGSLKPEYIKESAQLREHRDKLVEHNVFFEALAPRIAKAIFGDFLVVPENYFSLQVVSAEPKVQTPVIASKVIYGFDEFMARGATFQNKTKPEDHKEQIKRNSLRLFVDPKNVTSPSHPLSVAQAEILGKLYFVALVIMHWDIFNDINCTNSGETAGKPTIVDWGNSFGVGFNGLSSDQTAFKNPDFPSGFGGHRGVKSFEHTVPFCELVYPFLPRQIVSDLFDMSSDDPLSRAVLAGFMSGYEKAIEAIENLEQQVANGIKETLEKYCAAKDVDYVRAHLLDRSFYFPEGSQKDGHTLVNVLHGRIKSCGEMVEQLKMGRKLEDIRKERLQKILDSQETPADRKKKLDKSCGVTPSEAKDLVHKNIFSDSTPPDASLNVSVMRLSLA